MPEFAYEALTAAGVVAHGAMKAASEEELADLLRAEGAYLIRAEPRAEVPSRAARDATDGKVDRRELLALTEYLGSSIEAGIPILSTLDDVRGRLQSKRLQVIVGEIRTAMSERGQNLSDALREHPKAFSPLFVSTVAAGEASGHLDYALAQLAEHLNWQQEITTQLRQATTYPAIVLGAVGVLLTILVAFVFPKLFPIFATLDVDLPLPTRLIMAGAAFLQAWWAYVGAGLAALVVILFLLRRTPSGRMATDRLMLGMPVFGPLVHQITMARFVTYTALFYRTGVELLHGLTLVEGMMENRIVARAVREAREAVAAGDSMASAFGRTSLFPTIVVRSIALGESTGSLDEALAKAKAYYDREVPAAVRRMLTALQPMLVVVLGGVILVVALSIFLPIITVYQSVGR